ncbi:hypothetical protein DQ04_20051000 [Trypanosoma grayi]|uniref:hypothetical protein n=1 Tax=Trypanosoma grayi TaxID=71804 RepID=UPI0004F42E90|nr:hypothetical protein DQ04_20051000 [Trypanosoma grayi]KEG05609.1 hypothetical protein DQ04_20051000 [Trypanosoma grayi]
MMMMMRYVLLACAFCVCVGCGCAAGDDLKLLKTRLHVRHASSSEYPSSAIIAFASAGSKECLPTNMRCVRASGVAEIANEAEHTKCVEKTEECPQGYKPDAASSSGAAGSGGIQGVSHSGGAHGEELCPEGQTKCKKSESQVQVAHPAKLDVGSLKGGVLDRKDVVECKEEEVHCPAGADGQPSGGRCVPTGTDCSSKAAAAPKGREGEGEPSSGGPPGIASGPERVDLNPKGQVTQLGKESTSLGDSAADNGHREETDETDRRQEEETMKGMKASQKATEVTAPGPHDSQSVSGGRREEISTQGEKTDKGHTESSSQHTSNTLLNEANTSEQERKSDETSNTNNDSEVTNVAPAGGDSSPGDATTTAVDHSSEAPATQTPTEASSAASGVSDASDTKPSTTTAAVETINNTKNADSSVSPVWVHAPLLLLTLFAVTAV